MTVLIFGGIKMGWEDILKNKRDENGFPHYVRVNAYGGQRYFNFGLMMSDDEYGEYEGDRMGSGMKLDLEEAEKYGAIYDEWASKR